MTSKLLILILGISNLCAEKHIKGEPYDSILESDHKLTSSTDSWSYFASAVGSTSNKITFEDLKWIRLYSPHILHAFMCFVFEQMHNL